MSEGPYQSAAVDDYQDGIDDDVSTYESYVNLQYNANDALITAHDGSNDPLIRKFLKNLNIINSN